MELVSFFQADEYFEMVYHFANKGVETRQAKAKKKDFIFEI